MDKSFTWILSTLFHTKRYRFKSAFQFPFHIGKNALNIVQHGDKFELRINNQSFTHLYDNGKLLALTKYREN